MKPLGFLKLPALGLALLRFGASQHVRYLARINLSIRDAIPTLSPPSNCDNPVATSHGLDEEDLDYNEPIQHMNKFDAMRPEDHLSPMKKVNSSRSRHLF